MTIRISREEKVVWRPSERLRNVQLRRQAEKRPSNVDSERLKKYQCGSYRADSCNYRIEVVLMATRMKYVAEVCQTWTVDLAYLRVLPSI